MQFILLTHPREIEKKTNTGQLVKALLEGTRIILWQRTEPDASLLQLIEQGICALVYPVDDDPGDDCPDDVASTATKASTAHQKRYQYYILIDSTWQEARKIYNRSSYLHHLPRVNISSAKASRYSLRRNQKPGGLCTAECAITLLRQNRFDHDAELLEKCFMHFAGINSML